MLRSDLCDFSDAYYIVKGVIVVINSNKAKRNKAVAFKNNAPFISCISKINGADIDNAEDLDVVMLMHNLLEYSKNYTKATGSLQNYYSDEPSDPLSSSSESFKYKTNITGNTYKVGHVEAGYDADKVGKNETEIVIPLKHLSNIWRTLNIPLINCETELILTWSKNCALADMTGELQEIIMIRQQLLHQLDQSFKQQTTKLHVPVVALSKENDKKILDQLKLGFKRTVKWNK